VDQMATKRMIASPSAPSSDGAGEGEGEGAGRDSLDRAPVIRLTKNGIKGQRVTFAGYRNLMKVVRDGRSTRGRKQSAQGGLKITRPARLHMQRVAVRLTYKKNDIAGNWRAHGRYLERESATGREGEGRGFGHAGDDMPIATTLDGWQNEKDAHIFKLIISPEHGNRMDMREYTKAYMAALEKELGTRLEWVGAAHYNTDDDHVHVALRGRDDQGRTLRIPREFIKDSLRRVAGELATERLGHRTQADITDARQKQISQHRWTDLDRSLKRLQKDGEIDFSKPIPPHASDDKKELRMQQLRRLSVLENMGLARRGQGGRWAIDEAAETILRERQKANDRLKVMHSHRAMVSDPRLPLSAVPDGNARLAGRLIGTGADEAANRNYLLLESTQGSVMYLYQSPSFEIESGNGLKPGDFIVIKQTVTEGKDGKPRVSHFVKGHGDAEAALKNPKLVRSEVRHHIDRASSLPPGSVWGGWLGQFHQELVREAQALVKKGVIRQEGNRIVMDAPALPVSRNRPGRGTRPGR
jgi:type IV secretory pathway VirD2 relaxase